MTHATTLRDVRDAIRSRARSATEVCREALARIDALDPQLHAFNTIVADRAITRATAMDQEFDRWRDAGVSQAREYVPVRQIHQGYEDACALRGERRH
jgi:Asp-tRNA(Asn)/Glu-tRNA(Gln) amidotransferase A subunit family amidase